MDSHHVQVAAPPEACDDDERYEVLLLDDDSTVLTLAERVLAAAGHRCHSVTEPRTALSIVREREEIKAVVCDVYMPEMSGLEFVGGLRSLRLSRQVPPVLLMTAEPSLQTAVEALRLGVSDFIVKPVRPSELLESVRQAIRRADSGQPRRIGLPDIGRLVGHAEELARELRRLSFDDQASRKGLAPPAQLQDAELLELLETLRRLQLCHSKPELDDVAWELLLELLRAEQINARLSVSDLMISCTGASSTTALRRLNDLAEKRYVVRTPDASDRRREYVSLTPLGRSHVTNFVAEATEQVRLAYHIHDAAQ